MTITKELLRVFRTDLDKALKELEDKHGVQISVGAMTYSDTQFTFSSKAIIGGSPEEVEKAEFKKHCGKYGFKPENYGTVMLIGGKQCEFIGFKTRATKMPCLVRDIENGKKYKCDTKTISFRLNR